MEGGEAVDAGVDERERLTMSKRSGNEAVDSGVAEAERGERLTMSKQSGNAPAADASVDAGGAMSIRISSGRWGVNESGDMEPGAVVETAPLVETDAAAAPSALLSQSPTSPNKGRLSRLIFAFFKRRGSVSPSGSPTTSSAWGGAGYTMGKQSEAARTGTGPGPVTEAVKTDRGLSPSSSPSSPLRLVSSVAGSAPLAPLPLARLPSVGSAPLTPLTPLTPLVPSVDLAPNGFSDNGYGDLEVAGLGAGGTTGKQSEEKTGGDQVAGRALHSFLFQLHFNLSTFEGITSRGSRVKPEAA